MTDSTEHTFVPPVHLTGDDADRMTREEYTATAKKVHAAHLAAAARTLESGGDVDSGAENVQVETNVYITPQRVCTTTPYKELRELRAERDQLKAGAQRARWVQEAGIQMDLRIKAEAEVERLTRTLEWIANVNPDRRPDGTYNIERIALIMRAQEALK